MEAEALHAVGLRSARQEVISATEEKRKRDDQRGTRRGDSIKGYLCLELRGRTDPCNKGNDISVVVVENKMKVERDPKLTIPPWSAFYQRSLYARFDSSTMQDIDREAAQEQRGEVMLLDQSHKCGFVPLPEQHALGLPSPLGLGSHSSHAKYEARQLALYLPDRR